MGGAIIFAFVLFVMGGVTAYAGDRLGSYIGKKRHSSFGLRPRHTAMLWTVLSGGGIAIGTLLLLLLLDKTVKLALLQGPQLIEEKALLERQNISLTKRNLATERQAQMDGLRAAQAQMNAEQEQRTLLTVSQTLGQANASLGQSRSLLAQRQAALGAAQQHLAATRTGLEQTRQELAWAQAQVRAARRVVQVASLQVVQAEKSVLNLSITQDRLHAENTRLIYQNSQQESLLQASQGHAVIFRREEELGRTVVAASQPFDTVRRELAVFLDGIEQIARKRGAGGLDNAPAIVVPALGQEATDEPAAREAALDALSQNIVAQSGFMPSIVVVADARYNTFRGEPVKLDLKPYSNVMIYPKGTVIASDSIDGSQPEDVILKQLQAFLKERVRTGALSRGIIPIYDPQSGEPLVGQPIDSQTWVVLVKKIQQAGQDARIVAAAADDTYSADFLQLSLQVLPKDVSPPPVTTNAGMHE